MTVIRVSCGVTTPPLQFQQPAFGDEILVVQLLQVGHFPGHEIDLAFKRLYLGRKTRNLGVVLLDPLLQLGAAAVQNLAAGLEDSALPGQVRVDAQIGQQIGHD
jgi:hypothetical protein